MIKKQYILSVIDEILIYFDYWSKVEQISNHFDVISMELSVSFNYKYKFYKNYFLPINTYGTNNFLLLETWCCCLRVKKTKNGWRSTLQDNKRELNLCLKFFKKKTVFMMQPIYPMIRCNIVIYVNYHHIPTIYLHLIQKVF